MIVGLLLFQRSCSQSPYSHHPHGTGYREVEGHVNIVLPPILTEQQIASYGGAIWQPRIGSHHA
jgi:hypothetical protein